MKLYHATFRQYLESIKEYGLGGNITKRNHDISNEEVLVYLSEDYEECEIMISEADPIISGELTMDDVILLEVCSDDLDGMFLYPDANLNNWDEGTTSWEYLKVIPFDKIEVLDPNDYT